MKKGNSLWVAIALVATGLSAPAQAATLTTVFNTTNIAGGNWTNLFDLTVNNPSGVQITDYTVNVAQAGAPFILQVYVRPTTYVDFGNTPAAWTLVSTGTATTGANNGAVLIDVPDFQLTPGTYGMALVNTTYQVGFTTPAADFGNADLAIDNGAMATGPLSGGVILNTIWNGTITYNVIPEPGTAALAAFGVLGVFALQRSRRSTC